MVDANSELSHATDTHSRSVTHTPQGHRHDAGTMKPDGEEINQIPFRPPAALCVLFCVQSLDQTPIYAVNLRPVATQVSRDFPKVHTDPREKTQPKAAT